MWVFNTSTIQLSEEDLNRAQTRISEVITLTLIRYPLVYYILLNFKLVPKIGLGTFGVYIEGLTQLKLCYDPVLVLNLTDNELKYVLLHETLHIALHHCTSRKLGGDDLSNISKDLAINELLPNGKDAGCEIPQDKTRKEIGQLVKNYKKLKEFKDMEFLKSAEYYFRFLKEKDPKKNSTSKEDTSNQKGEGSSEGEDNNSNQKGENDKSFNPESSIDTHEGWKENSILEDKIRDIIKEIDARNQWGNTSASLKETILAAQIKKIRWESLIHTILGNIIWRETESTRRKPNRRTGILFPGYKKIYKDRILIAVDTSGSTAELWGKFLGVLNQIQDYTPMDIMQVDCAVQSKPQPFENVKKRFTFLGGGGTSFEPIIDTVNNSNYKMVVIVTDGEAPECTKPKNTKVLWVLPENHTPPVPWGTRVHISDR